MGNLSRRLGCEDGEGGDTDGTARQTIPQVLNILDRLEHAVATLRH